MGMMDDTNGGHYPDVTSPFMPSPAPAPAPANMFDSTTSSATSPFPNGAASWSPPAAAPPDFDTYAVASNPSAPPAHAQPASQGYAKPQTGLHVTITQPQVCHESGKMPGGLGKYITYAVTVEASADARLLNGTSVRRRFSDFVLLDSLLKVTHRGHFIPPRPLKHVGKMRGKLKDAFTERRRQALEAYLHRLCSHPVLAKSAELRVFLTTHDDLRFASAWQALAHRQPTVLSGAKKLLNQMVGRENWIPQASEAAQPSGSSHDVVRQVKEAVYSYRHKKDMPLPPVEMRIRDRADTLRGFCSAVATLSHHMVVAQAALSSRVAAAGAAGRALEHLGAFEQSAARLEIAHTLKAAGAACVRFEDTAGPSVGAAGCQTRALQEQARMLAGVVAALAARSEALVTMQTLSADAAAKRARSEKLQSQQHKNALKALHDLATAEAVVAAATAEFETVAARNEADMAGFAPQQAADAAALMLNWVKASGVLAEVEAEAWLGLCEQLGCDSKHVAAIAAL